MRRLTILYRNGTATSLLLSEAALAAHMAQLLGPYRRAVVLVTVEPA